MANYIPENSWHYDCSNLTDFDGIGDDTWFADPGYNVSGTMNTSGSYFYAESYGAGSFGHGPLRYNTLSAPLRVSQFISLEAVLELDEDAPSTNQLGHIMVMLYDDNQEEVIAIHARQTWDNDGYPTKVEAFARWRFSNGTKIEPPVIKVQEPYHETLKISQNETGIFANFPRIGNFSILSHDEVEPDRVIKYVAIYLAATMSFPPTDILRIHDIVLSYDISPPVIEGPDDIHYDEFTTGHSISWNVSDTNPSSSTLFINNDLNTSEVWDGSNFSFDIDNLEYGTHNYTLVLEDAVGNLAADTVLVYIHDGDDPLITSPEDLQFIEGTLGQVITWIGTDEHPTSYQILINGTPIKSNLWNTSSESISIEIDNFVSGAYNYTCIISDIDSNLAWDEVIVTVKPSTTSTTTNTSTATTGTSTSGFQIDQQTSTFIITGGAIAFIAIILIWRRSRH